MLGSVQWRLLKNHGLDQMACRPRADNQEAQYYGVYPSNHGEVAEPYFGPISGARTQISLEQISEISDLRSAGWRWRWHWEQGAGTGAASALGPPLILGSRTAWLPLPRAAADWMEAARAAAQQHARGAGLTCPPDALHFSCHLAPWGYQSHDQSTCTAPARPRRLAHPQGRLRAALSRDLLWGLLGESGPPTARLLSPCCCAVDASVS